MPAFPRVRFNFLQNVVGGKFEYERNYSAGGAGGRSPMAGADNSTQKSDKKRKEEILGKEQAR